MPGVVGATGVVGAVGATGTAVVAAAPPPAPEAIAAPPPRIAVPTASCSGVMLGVGPIHLPKSGEYPIPVFGFNHSPVISLYSNPKSVIPTASVTPDKGLGTS